LYGNRPLAYIAGSRVVSRIIDPTLPMVNCPSDNLCNCLGDGTLANRVDAIMRAHGFLKELWDGEGEPETYTDLDNAWIAAIMIRKVLQPA
jgi:hypothetical protein